MAQPFFFPPFFFAAFIKLAKKLTVCTVANWISKLCAGDRAYPGCHLQYSGRQERSGSTCVAPQFYTPQPFQVNCRGSPQYPYGKFVKIHYLINSEMISFWIKTAEGLHVSDSSFHEEQPVFPPSFTRRDRLLVLFGYFILIK